MDGLIIVYIFMPYYWHLKSRCYGILESMKTSHNRNAECLKKNGLKQLI